MKHLSVAPAVLLVVCLGCGGGSSTTPPTTPTTPTVPIQLPAELTFTADPGIRVTGAALPRAGVDASGLVYLYYELNPGFQRLVATSSDGLNFGAGVPWGPNNMTAHPIRTRMPDGSWRHYQLGPQTK